MRTLADFNFVNSWHAKHMALVPGQEYLVHMDRGDLKKGQRVTFVGFDDVDNHYGIFVFTDAEGRILEAGGDYCGAEHTAFHLLRAALALP